MGARCTFRAISLVSDAELSIVSRKTRCLPVAGQNTALKNDMLSIGRMSTLHYLNLKIFRHEQKVGMQVKSIIYCT